MRLRRGFLPVPKGKVCGTVFVSSFSVAGSGVRCLVSVLAWLFLKDTVLAGVTLAAGLLAAALHPQGARVQRSLWTLSFSFCNIKNLS